MYHCYDRSGLDDAWVYAGGGGFGGCGGRAGRAGGTGTSVVGMILVPPSQGTLDLTELASGAFIKLTAGGGGAGQKGQEGRYGGFRGYGFGHGTENWANIDKHCHKAMAGGIGGTGGGGGGGAGGLAGHVYSMAFICNRNVEKFDAVQNDQFEDCGFKMYSNWAEHMLYAEESDQTLGTAGGDGADGAKAKKMDNIESSSKDSPSSYGYVSSRDNAEKPASSAAGGDGGGNGANASISNNEPGAGRTGDFKSVLMLHNTNFK